MSILSSVLVLALTTVNLDVVTVPLSNEIKIALTPGARSEIRREGTVTRIKIDIDRVAAPSTLGPAFNTYVVWAMSPEGILDNLGELEVKGGKGLFSATTRLTQFGLFITAEPHYMVDQPSSAVAYRSQIPETDVRRRTMPAEVGTYDYSQLKPVSSTGVHNYRSSRRCGAFSTNRFSECASGVGRPRGVGQPGSPVDILWPTAHEAIRWSQRAAATARGKR
ncbi:MAG: hypothetical protein DMG14_17995 [Acidobacteria bacterium]|nr:MAG: hypothetical protein DMG14_17995 [Acidobacteriota bacterium]